MANISDIIEHFILATMGSADDISLSRNELADYFNCAPSQINYVLSTRFNLNRGYIIQSQRGGGGYIKVLKIKDFDNSYIYRIIDNNLSGEISFKDAKFLLEDLVQKKLISTDKAQILLYAISDKALSNPIKMEGNIRSNILKNVLANIAREEEVNE